MLNKTRRILALCGKTAHNYIGEKIGGEIESGGHVSGFRFNKLIFTLFDKFVRRAERKKPYQANRYDKKDKNHH